MKRFSKALVTLLVVITILGTLSVGFAAPVPSDVKGTDYEDAVNRLAALEIMAGFPDGTFKPGDALTRAQAARIVVSALGLNKAADLAKGATQFTDVPADHWASGYINIATSQGIIVGMGDGTFKPEEKVTYAQILKMMLMALNYGPALQKATWPAGYISKADEIGLSEDVAVAANVPATRGDVAKIVDNALDIPMLVQNQWGDFNTWEQGDPAKDTLLIKKHKATEFKGRVIATPANDADLEENEVTLSYTNDNDAVVTRTFELATSDDPESLLGREVTIWVKNDKAFFVAVDTSAADIFNAVAKLDSGKFVLGGKNYSLAADATVYINDGYVTLDDGVTLVNYVSGLASNEFVKGTFILKDGKVVFANVYSYVEKGIVTKVDVARERIYAGTTVSLGSAGSYTIVNDGAVIGLEDISKGDVVYQAQLPNDADGNPVYRLEVVSKKVEGEVTKVKSNDVYIDGTKYTAITGVVLDGADALLDLPGESVVATLNLAGKIMKIEVGESTSNFYAYAYKVWANNAEDTYSVRVLKADGTKTILTSEDDVVVSNVYAQSNLFDVSIDADDLATLESVNMGTELSGYAVDKDRDRLTKAGSAAIYIQDSTVIYNVTDPTNPKVVTWETLEKASANFSGVHFYVYGSPKAKVILITSGYDALRQNTEYARVDDAYKTSDGWKFDLEFNGETESVLISGTFTGGATALDFVDKLIEFTRTSSGKVDASSVTTAFWTATGHEVTADEVDYEYFAHAGTEYIIADDVVVYVWNDEDGVWENGSLGDVHEGDTVDFLVDDDTDTVTLIAVTPNL